MKRGTQSARPSWHSPRPWLPHDLKTLALLATVVFGFPSCFGSRENPPADVTPSTDEERQQEARRARPATTIDHGEVVAVHDGDTISVMLNGRAERVRLEGIDCPERGQGYSKQAKHRTAELVYGKTVTLRTVGKDRYGRLIARVYAGDLDVSLALVREGYAWHFTRYSDDPELAAAQEEAQRSGRGVWSQPYPLEPWAQRGQ